MEFVAIPLYAPIVTLLLGALLLTIVGLSGNQNRLSLTAWSWLAALFPFTAVLVLLGFTTAVLDTTDALQWQFLWLPTLDWPFSLYFDNLTALFALIITGIGTLIMVYTGYYFKGDNSAWRFLAYMLLFMAAMLGLVMAGDIIALFFFWELTSITSYLLVGYKHSSPDARAGAFKALFITGGGGIALLGGLIMVSVVAGGTTWEVILGSGDVLRASWLYPVMLGLVAFGAFTKSAQFPAHIWLPRAMTAPTPASAFLHSATMVKAGIYLLARVNPALGMTEMWFWLLTIVGGTTMVMGAYLGLKQYDLKALLAYSTISQLGVLVILIGQDTEIAFKAMVIGVLAHALFKSALFMVAGNVDHETGTRDLRRLGGLRTMMPYTFGVAVLAALSLAGLPPMLGFLAKETLLATSLETTVHPSMPILLVWIFPTAVVLTGAFKIVHAGLIVIDGFTGEQKDTTIHAHETPLFMWLVPGIPALLSLLIGILPESPALATLLAGAAGAAYGDPVKVSMALWTGLNIPLLLSVIAIGLGSTLFYFRDALRARLIAAPSFSLDQIGYDKVLNALDDAAWWATRLQYGRLRTYLTVILLALLGLVALFGGWFMPDLAAMSLPSSLVESKQQILRLLSMVMAAAAATTAVILRRDFYAILALGVSGLAVAVVMILEPAPDIALVQIVVDLLAVVILVLALTRLPRSQRRAAQELNQFNRNQLGPAVAAIGVGLLTALISFTALVNRPNQESVVTPFYELNAKLLVGATDIVGSILIEFRALDTLIEISVFGLAGVGVYTLLRYATQKWGDDEASRALRAEETPLSTRTLTTRGIGGKNPSPLLRLAGYMLLPFSLILAATHIMYGHDQPGDGFTAGVIVGLAIGFWYIVFGYEKAVQKLSWVKPTVLVGGGLLLAMGTAVVAAFWMGSFFGHVNFGEYLGLPLPDGLYFSTALLFELAIALTVVGSVAHMLNSIGRPQDEKSAS